MDFTLALQELWRWRMLELERMTQAERGRKPLGLVFSLD